jgi:hypothetical protein
MSKSSPPSQPSSLCSSSADSNTTTFNMSDLNKLYTGPYAILPTSVTTENRQPDTRLQADFVKSYVTSKIHAGIVPVQPSASAASASASASATPTPTPTPTPISQKDIAAFSEKNAAFMQSVAVEYCFYESRYRYAVTQLATALKEAYESGNSAKNQAIDNYLQATKALNQKLNDLTQIVQEIVKQRMAISKQAGDSAATMSNEMTEKSKKLMKQMDMLSKDDSKEELYKEMIRYSEQKVRRTDNLLSLYSFLNIVLLSALVYVYRSASNNA